MRCRFEIDAIISMLFLYYFRPLQGRPGSGAPVPAQGRARTRLDKTGLMGLIAGAALTQSMTTWDPGQKDTASLMRV